MLLPEKKSRREFLSLTAFSSAGILLSSSSFASAGFFASGPDSKVKGVQIGCITYSFRSMPGSIENLVGYCVKSGISAIELMGDAAEDFAGAPKNPMPWPPQGRPTMTPELQEKIKVYQKELARWRENTGFEKFEEIRKLFKKEGISIYAFKPNALNASNTDGEITYALKAAKALGANSVTVELPTDSAHSKRLGNLAEKQGVYIGYHAHLQATDTAWDTALEQSPYNSLNLDCGHYIAAGGKNTRETLLALIEAKHKRITSMHIKDRLNKEHGGKNMPWGQGDTPLKEILSLLRDKKYKIPASIELEYDIPAGSDAVAETRKCFEYAKSLLES